MILSPVLSSSRQNSSSHIFGILVTMFQGNYWCDRGNYVCDKAIIDPSYISFDIDYFDYDFNGKKLYPLKVHQYTYLIQISLVEPIFPSIPYQFILRSTFIVAEPRPYSTYFGHAGR